MSAYRPTFVSHTYVDNDLCDRYVTALRARGIDTWYDRNDAQAGHFLGTDIQRELQQRTAFVLLMTQQALDSFWVQLELQAYLGLMAQDRSRILLPVRIGPCQVPPFLNALFWVDAQAIPFDQAIDGICTALITKRVPSAQQHFVPLPPLGPAPVPANSAPALHLTPTSLYSLGFRGYSIGGVECVLPPVCPVPAGVFTMGGDENRDGELEDDEMPQYPVEVDDFAIAQHPITVAEYACAVRALALKEPSKWEPPFYYSSRNSTDWQKQQTHSDHPVVCVSWNEAVAYATWLERLTGQLWRLPTEAEWEKAARGTDGRIYPWGDRFDEARCNTAQSSSETTTPVGRYPNGESLYHAQDMAGNVWEWTSSLFSPYPYRKNDGRENTDSTGGRVVRGGCWFNNSNYARTTCRMYLTPDDPESIDSSLGFRLVVAPRS